MPSKTTKKTEIVRIVFTFSGRLGSDDSGSHTMWQSGKAFVISPTPFAVKYV